MVLALAFVPKKTSGILAYLVDPLFVPSPFLLPNTCLRMVPTWTLHALKGS